ILGASDGYVNSAGLSPTLGSWIGLGLLREGRARMGEIIRAYDPVRTGEAELEVCSHHFLDPSGARLRVERAVRAGATLKFSSRNGGARAWPSNSARRARADYLHRESEIGCGAPGRKDPESLGNAFASRAAARQSRCSVPVGYRAWKMAPSTARTDSQRAYRRRRAF